MPFSSKSQKASFHRIRLSYTAHFTSVADASDLEITLSPI